MSTQDELFSAVDALLEQASPLPSPDERRRLRAAAGLAQADIARALGVRAGTVAAWETGRSEPTLDRRAAYARLLGGLADRYPAPDTTTEPDPEVRVEPEPAPAPSLSPEDRAPAPRTPGPAGARDSRYPAGPLAVLDGAGTAHLADGRDLPCPASTLPQLADWALTASLGLERLHRAGRDADPLVVLTAAAATRLGLPAELEDRRGLRLPDDHPVVREVTAEGWRLTRRGFGPWARLYRPVDAGRRQCVQLAVLPWDALDARAWRDTGSLPPAELAGILGTYATRVLTPRGSTAVCGLELMTALRPPTRAVSDQAGGWTSGPVPGSLTQAVDPAPPEAPPE
ncbi:helix-turn-helix domain-containing protein, partial [Streptomyces hainanensis]